MVAYDAFISYSHAKDKSIAAALQSVIQRLGKSWYKRRALRVFRDDTSLSATPQLWPGIERALDESRFLILLASPEAAASTWVNKEVVHWLEHKGADTLLIALTDGELLWDGSIGDFSRREDGPLPPALTGRFPMEPKWVNLCTYREKVDPRDGRFMDVAADLAAAIHSIPKEDLLSQEVRQQRRALTLAWSAAASLLAISVLAAWQWRTAIESERIAVAEGIRAERNFGAAKETIDAVVFDLAQGLKDVEGMRAETVRRILSRAETAVAKLAARTENDPEVRRSQAAMFGMFSDTYSRLGDFELAADYAHKAIVIARELSVAYPSNVPLRHNLSVALQMVGYALRARGDFSGALVAYREQLDLSRALVAQDPGNTQWWHDVSVALEGVGRILSVQGDLDGALAAYRENLDISRRLSAKDPHNNEFGSDQSASLILIGGVLMAQGDNAGALAACRESLDIIRQLSAKDTSNTAFQRQMSASLSGVGAALQAQGDAAGASAAYRESLDILRNLSVKDSDNNVWRREMSVSLSSMGDSLKLQGDLDGALAAYRENRDIVQTFAAKEPNNVGWWLGLAVGLDKIGDVLSAKGDLAGAYTAYHEKLQILRELSARDSNDAARQREVSVGLNKVGDALRAQNNLPGALAAYRESLDIMRQLTAKDSGNRLWQSDVAFSLTRLATAGDDAAGQLTEALAILRKLKSLDSLPPAQKGWIETIQSELDKLNPSSDALLPMVEQIQGTYEGTNITNQMSGERPISLAFSQVGSDVTVIYRSQPGGQGSGTGSISHNQIAMDLYSETPNCPGSYSASFEFSGDTVSWTYAGYDCGGPAQGHGLAKKANAGQTEAFSPR